MNDLVLVDSSAWIRYLLHPRESTARVVEALLATHRVAVNAVIRVELLTGARDKRQYTELEDAFGGLHALEITEAVWRRAERLRFELRCMGHLVPVPDVVIACCALVYGCSVLHVDRHFDRIVHVTTLKIHRGVA